MDSNQTRLLESGVGTVLVDGLNRLGTQLDLHVTTKFRYVDTLGVEVGRYTTLHHLGHVTTDSTLLLGKTGTVNSTTDTDAGTSDATYFGHFSRLV